MSAERKEPTMERRLVIFDSDGVLVDSEGIIHRVLAQELGRDGVRMSAEDTGRHFYGFYMPHVIATVESEFGVRLPADFPDRWYAAVLADFERELKPIPGVAGAVEQLVADGYEVCVASNGPLNKIEVSLRVTGLLEHFAGRQFSAWQVDRGKPSPALFQFAAAQLDFPSSRCLVVEDSLPGVQAAVAAGMAVLAYTPDGPGREVRALASRTFSDMAELRQLVQETFG
jgi:HAD superfamily hydrolase (TIGR01509 family)